MKVTTQSINKARNAIKAAYDSLPEEERKKWKVQYQETYQFALFLQGQAEMGNLTGNGSEGKDATEAA